MTKRQVFYSFHFKNDSWRAGQVRNIGVVEGNTPVSSNDWEEVKRKGDDSIKRWIDTHMDYRSCVIVLIGSDTASRKWCRYEIKHAWKEGKGVVGIYVHNLKNIDGEQDIKGDNPFKLFCVDKTFNYIVEHKHPADSNEINLSIHCNVINRFLTVPFLQDFTIEIMTSSIRGTSNFLYSFVSSQKTTRYIFSIIMS